MYHIGDSGEFPSRGPGVLRTMLPTFTGGAERRQVAHISLGTSGSAGIEDGCVCFNGGLSSASSLSMAGSPPDWPLALSVSSDDGSRLSAENALEITVEVVHESSLGVERAGLNDCSWGGVASIAELVVVGFSLPESGEVLRDLGVSFTVDRCCVVIWLLDSTAWSLAKTRISCGVRGLGSFPMQAATCCNWGRAMVSLVPPCGGRIATPCSPTVASEKCLFLEPVFCCLDRA